MRKYACPAARAARWRVAAPGAPDRPGAIAQMRTSARRVWRHPAVFYPIAHPEPGADDPFRPIPQASAVASGYASALIEACSDKKALESVHGDMETIAAYMAANPSVGTFLSNPTMEDKAKKDIITKLGKEADFHPFTANFLNLLVDKKRIQNVEDIVEEFENLYCESTDTQVRIAPDRPFFSSTAIRVDRSPAPEARPAGRGIIFQPIQPLPRHPIPSTRRMPSRSARAWRSVAIHFGYWRALNRR